MLKHYELDWVLNAPIDSYIASETEPNTRLNNSCWSTKRYLNTILLLEHFSGFGYLRVVLRISINDLKAYSQQLGHLNEIFLKFLDL